MLIWDIIRDWFVLNIWGGTTSQAVTQPVFTGFLFDYENGEYDDGWIASLDEVRFLIGHNGDNSNIYIGLSDWLSTMSTIIVLVAVSVGLYFLTRYFFRMFAGLLSGR